MSRSGSGSRSRSGSSLDENARRIVQAYVLKLHEHVLTTCLGAGITSSADIKAIKRAIGRLVLISSESRRDDDSRDELFDVDRYEIVGKELSKKMDWSKTS